MLEDKNLVQIDESDALLSENKNLSSDELEKIIIQKGNEKIPEPEKEKEPESVKEPEKEPESIETEQEKETELKEDSLTPSNDNDLGYLRKQNETLLQIIQSKLTEKAKPIEQKPQKTKEEQLEELTEDPIAFVKKYAIDPQKAEIRRLEELQALDMARRNPEYSRLEKIINRIKSLDQYKKLGMDLNPLDREEIFFRLAKSLEYDYKEQKARKQQDDNLKKRESAKKEAASVNPKPVKKVSDSEPVKSVENMNSSEIEKMLKKMGAA